MPFPELVPTSRSYDPGDFANKKYSAQDGAEFRILYGDKRVGMTLKLSYRNITDQQAQLFVDHFHEMKGTFEQFDIGTAVRGGWAGSSLTFRVVGLGSQWRYDSPPQLESVYPGVSSVSVSLKAATI